MMPVRLASIAYVVKGILPLSLLAGLSGATAIGGGLAVQGQGIDEHVPLLVGIAALVTFLFTFFAGITRWVIVPTVDRRAGEISLRHEADAFAHRPAFKEALGEHSGHLNRVEIQLQEVDRKLDHFLTECHAHRSGCSRRETDPTEFDGTPLRDPEAPSRPRGRNTE